MAAPSDDWRGVILLAYLAGLWLKDCLSLTWANVDLPRRALSLIPRKTARTGKKLLFRCTRSWKGFSQTSGKWGGKRSGFPSCRLSAGGNRGASRLFQNIMAKAGVASGILREGAGKSGRKVAERSFHSLRHSYVTALAHANVVELRQKLAGHASEKGQSLPLHTARIRGAA